MPLSTIIPLYRGGKIYWEETGVPRENHQPVTSHGAVGHNLKWDYPRTIPAKSSLIWFSGFRGEDLNVIFYQNMPNLHNR